MSWDLGSKVLYVGGNTAPLNPRATLCRGKHFRRASQVHGYRLLQGKGKKGNPWRDTLRRNVLLKLQADLKHVGNAFGRRT